MPGTLILETSNTPLLLAERNGRFRECSFQTGTRGSGLSQRVSPLTRVGGLPLLLRAIHTARRAGFERFILVFGSEEEALRQAINGQKEGRNLAATLVWIDTHRLAKGDQETTIALCKTVAGAIFVAGPRTLFDHTALEEIERAAVKAPEAVWIPEGKAVLALFPKTFFEPVRLTEIVQAGIPKERIREISPCRGVCLEINDGTDVREAETRLLRNTGNALDGYLDRYLNRRLSEPITLLLLKTPLTPNQITLLTLLVGFASALLFFSPNYFLGLLGALVFLFSSVLDCCDGAVARLKFMESRLGRWLDDTCDTLVFLALFLAIGWSHGTGDGTAWTTLAGALALGTTGSFLVVSYVSAKAMRRPSLDKIGRRIQTIAPRDFAAVLLAFALLGKLRWLIFGVAISANLFWVLFLGMILRNGSDD